MSNNQIALLQPQGAGALAPVSSVFHPLMQDTQSSELQQGVGATFGVVSIKGKTFSIKHGGTSVPMTVTYNGAVYAAPYFDVVLVKANGALSKTYYRDGYTEGSDTQPDCWSEDGVNPLAPMNQRPIDDRTNQPCIDCRMCPMNRFGSKVGSDTGSKGKACADTRKVAIVPVLPTGQAGANGIDPGVVDFDNSKYGGPMLVRVPAASLRELADYDQQLAGVGFPYYGVVTRLSFDSDVAYPKLKLQAIRGLADHEATALVKMRESTQVANILNSAQAGAPAPAAALPPPVQAAPSAVAALAPPVQQAPVQMAPPPVQAAPAQYPPQLPPQAAPGVQPVQQAPAATAAPVQAPPPPPAVQAPPPAPLDPVAAARAAGWAEHPSGGGWWYLGERVIQQADMLALFAAPPAPVQMAPPPVPQAAAMVPPAGAVPQAAAPTPTAAMLQTVDSLLQGQ